MAAPAAGSETGVATFCASVSAEEEPVRLVRSPSPMELYTPRTVELPEVRAAYLEEEFENGGSLPAGWTLTTAGRAWEATVESARYGTICGTGDYAMTCDSDRAGSGVAVDSWLKSPVIDCSAGTDLHLSFYHRYNYYQETSLEGIFVYVANDGGVTAADALVYHQYTVDIDLELVDINISALADGQNDVQLGFRYVANYDYWWVVDSVAIEEYVAPPPPPPTFFEEEFENGGSLPAGWTLTTAGRAWEATVESARYGTICGTGDYAMTCDSDRAGSGVAVDSWLKSPVIDCSNREFIDLVFEHRYDWYSEGSAEGAFVYIATDGSVDSSDAVVFHEYTGDIALETRRVNISAVADKEASVQIGFRYVANYDYWWIVDDLILQGRIADKDAPAAVTTLGASAGDSNATLDWAGYDEAGQGDVAGYRIYMDAVPITDVSGLTPVAEVPAGVFQHTLFELRNGDARFFAVTAIDEVPNENKLVTGAGPVRPLPWKVYSIPLEVGWNLVSLPVIQQNTSVPAVLNSIDGMWDYLMFYDSGTPEDFWKKYYTGWPTTFNDLSTMDHTQAFWLRATSACNLVVSGAVPENESIQMQLGWNMVGFPCTSTVATVSQAMSGVAYDLIEGFDGSEEYLVDALAGGDPMCACTGYWVHCTADSTMSVSNDVLAPVISSTAPAAGAVNVPTSSTVEITFSETMDQASAESSFSVSPPTAGTFSWSPDAATLTFTPSSPLGAGPTTYTITVGKGASDTSQNGKPWVDQFSFTTVDQTPPTVQATDPTDGQQLVPPGTNIVVTFGEAMNQVQTQLAFSVAPPVAGAFSWNAGGTVMTFNPTANLALLTTYTVTIGTGARDLAGNAIAASYVFDFRTSADPVEKKAIIVGISDYDFISDLIYCDEDTYDCYNYFSSHGYDCQVFGDGPSGGSVYPIYTGDATEANVRAAIQAMEATLTSNDWFVYTTSGHGDGDGFGSSWLCQLDCSGPAGCYYDTELQADLNGCAAEKIFVLIDHCFSGGMGPELMSMPNNDQVYCTTTCTENGYGYDDPPHLNGAWTYWYLEWGWVDGNGALDCEGNFDAADAQYNPGGGDEPMEFDGDPSTLFYIV